MRRSCISSVVTSENAVIVSRYSERPNWASTDTDERRWRQSSCAPACVLWCRGSGRSWLRLLQPRPPVRILARRCLPSLVLTSLQQLS
jgi:hypothetical protein